VTTAQTSPILSLFPPPIFLCLFTHNTRSETRRLFSFG
jgi:hypothetical protein